MTQLAPLLVLYFAQGLPFGLQATALPLLLRERGASLQTVGFAGVLALPWLLKALWAPWVDRYGHPRLGRRKTWIVSMQLLLAGLALFSAHSGDSIALLCLGILLMNLCAATQDIAVDGWAVSILRAEQLGPGNALQVVGYKLGMLVGGGLLVWASGYLKWSGVFYAVAALMVAICIYSLRLPEPADDHVEAQALPKLSETLGRLRILLSQRSGLALLAIVASYKTGESMADAMWKPLLLDQHFTGAQIGLWAGTYGMTCSLLGSAGAGFLARELGALRALLPIALLRTLGLAGEWWISVAAPSATPVIAVTCLEHLLGGALTTILFALMMGHTDRRIGGTHYTLLASVEVVGKMPPGLISGAIAQRAGYPALFALGTALSLAFVVLCFALRPALASTPPAEER